MTIFELDLNLGTGNKTDRLVEAIRAAIGRGQLKPGDRMPTQRKLARDLGFSLGTVSRAYALAMQQGLIHGEVGRGTFVRAQAADNWRFLPEFQPPADFDLSVNIPVRCSGVDEEALSSTMAAIFSDQSGPAILTRFCGRIDRRHRETGAAWFARLGWEVRPENVLIGAGFHPSLFAAIQLTTRPGDLILTEELTYPGIKPIARVCGVRLRGIAIDEYGMVPEALEEACRRSAAKLLYCRPTHHIATTATMTLKRRQRVAELVIKHGLTLIEDDDENVMSEQPLPSVSSFIPDHGVFIAGLGRALALGLGTSYLVVPTALRNGLEQALDELMWMKNPLLTEIAARWIETGWADRLIGAKREELRARHEIATRMLAGLRFSANPSAHHVWLELPPPWQRDVFRTAAWSRGVTPTPTAAFFVGRGAMPCAVRLCLGAPPDRVMLEAALARLNEVLQTGPEQARVVL